MFEKRLSVTLTRDYSWTEPLTCAGQTIPTKTLISSATAHRKLLKTEKGTNFSKGRATLILYFLQLEKRTTPHFSLSGAIRESRKKEQRARVWVTLLLEMLRSTTRGGRFQKCLLSRCCSPFSSSRLLSKTSRLSCSPPLSLSLSLSLWLSLPFTLSFYF